jgi:uncharacterized membrane protein YadS
VHPNQGPLLPDTRHTNELGKPPRRRFGNQIFADQVMSGSHRRSGAGLIAASVIAVLAGCLRTIPLLSVISPMMLAMLIGMSLNNVAGPPSWMKDGTLFSQRRLLRIAVVLVGFQLTFAEVVTLGAIRVVILASALASTFVFTVHVHDCCAWTKNSPS